jgi:hypothetical protein
MNPRPNISGRFAEDGSLELVVQPSHPRYLDVVRLVSQQAAQAANPDAGMFLSSAAAPAALSVETTHDAKPQKRRQPKAAASDPRKPGTMIGTSVLEQFSGLSRDDLRRELAAQEKAGNVACVRTPSGVICGVEVPADKSKPCCGQCKDATCSCGGFTEVKLDTGDGPE